MKRWYDIGREWAEANGREPFSPPGEPSTMCGWGSVNGAAGSPQPSDLTDDVFRLLEGPFKFEKGLNAAHYHSRVDAFTDLGRAVVALEESNRAGVVTQMYSALSAFLDRHKAAGEAGVIFNAESVLALAAVHSYLNTYKIGANNG